MMKPRIVQLVSSIAVAFLALAFTDALVCGKPVLEVIRTLFGPEGPDWLEGECGSLAPLVCALAGPARDLAAAKADGSLRDLVNEAHGIARHALAAYEATRAGFPRSVVPDRTEW